MANRMKGSREEGYRRGGALCNGGCQSNLLPIFLPHCAISRSWGLGGCEGRLPDQAGVKSISLGVVRGGVYSWAACGHSHGVAAEALMPAVDRATQGDNEEDFGSTVGS